MKVATRELGVTGVSNGLARVSIARGESSHGTSNC